MRPSFLPVLLATSFLCACSGPSTDAADDTDTEAGDTDSNNQDTDTSPTDTDAGDTDADAGDTGIVGTFVGCTGESGSCDTLTGDACANSGLLGCGVAITVDCAQQVYCIDVFDGCPPAFCTGSGDLCAWRDDADRIEAQACSTHTTSSACASVLCQVFDVNCDATGTWSCDLSFDDTGMAPDAGVCNQFDALGFDCDPVFE